MTMLLADLSTAMLIALGVLLVGSFLACAYQMLIEPANRPLDSRDRNEVNQRELLVNFEHLVGKTGTATTDLLPSGRAEIDGEPVDVICQGGVIERGDPITVIEAHANRVVVRRVET